MKTFMARTAALKKQVSSREQREALLSETMFLIGKRCREWFDPLQQPEAIGLRNAGAHLMGQSVLRPPFLISRPNSRFDLVWLLLEGEMRLTTLEGTAMVRAGEVWAVPAGALARFELLRGTARMNWFHLDPGTLPRSLHQAQPVRLEKETPVARRMQFYIELLREEEFRIDSHSHQLRHKLYELIEIELSRLLRGGKREEPEAIPRVERIWDSVEKDPGQPWDVAAMAGRAQLSPSRFHVLCLQHFGMTPHEKLTRIRMNRAVGLLLSSEEKIEAVARATGYSGLPAFSKAFNKAFGLRPKTFRLQRGSPPLPAWKGEAPAEPAKGGRQPAKGAA